MSRLEPHSKIIKEVTDNFLTKEIKEKSKQNIDLPQENKHTHVVGSTFVQPSAKKVKLDLNANEETDAIKLLKQEVCKRYVGKFYCVYF